MTVPGNEKKGDGGGVLGYGLLARLLVYVYSLNWFSYITADPDLWGHVKFGGDIWAQGAIPATDPFSYTAFGQPWTNHEWLSEVIFYLVYSAFGSTGLLLFKALIGLAVVGILTSLTLDWFERRAADGAGRGTARAIYIATFFLAAPAMAPAFMVRPHLLTLLFLAVLTAILRDHFDAPTGDRPSGFSARNPLAWTPPLFAVWANCHGGVTAGIGIFGLATAAEWVQNRMEGKDRPRELSLFFALSCLALLATPYGFNLLVYLQRALSLHRPIGEWGPIPLLDGRFLAFKIMAAVFLATLFFTQCAAGQTPGGDTAMTQSDRRNAISASAQAGGGVGSGGTLGEIAVLLVAVAYGFKQQRHSPLAAILLAPYLFRQGLWLAERLAAGKFPENLSPAFHAVAKTVAVLFVAFQLHGAWFKYRSNDFQILVEPGAYPSYAVRFMTANGIGGNILVPFDWGEYVIWKLPGSKVSVDGRFETVYPAEVVRKNLAFSAGLPGWEAMLKDYPADVILIRRSDRTDVVLERDGQWVRIYEDPATAIFVPRSDPPGPALQKHYNRELVDPPGPPGFHFP
ncbi:MAG: hypothetical protein HY579_12265 [Nitrospinae bacterium]|nr:hypothetical protein [Nitrospinota bacterium]